ncbi:hypothetical protein SDC9_117802 [bioreactor metagenome]|uniref:Uncharacterized protein n=1 Tax=bioreactor metagenome TaxID=1076179 RepID=A0A645C1N5_9ZZZZ
MHNRATVTANRDDQSTIPQRFLVRLHRILVVLDELVAVARALLFGCLHLFAQKPERRMRLLHLPGSIKGILNAVSKAEQLLCKGFPHQGVQIREGGTIIKRSMTEPMELVGAPYIGEQVVQVAAFQAEPGIGEMTDLFTYGRE